MNPAAGGRTFSGVDNTGWVDRAGDWLEVHAVVLLNAGAAVCTAGGAWHLLFGSAVSAGYLVLAAVLLGGVAHTVNPRS